MYIKSDKQAVPKSSRKDYGIAYEGMSFDNPDRNGFFENGLLMNDPADLSPVFDDQNIELRTGLRILIDNDFEDKQSTIDMLRNTPVRNRRSNS